MHKTVRAILFSLGTEITEGIIQDTHGKFLASELNSLGIRVEQICALRDGPDATTTLQEAIHGYDLIIITGGLGPTTDDITREAVASAAGVPIVYQEELFDAIERNYALSKAKANRRQARIPEGFTVIENHNGTAPGFWGVVNGSLVAALPGPPRELRPMFFDSLKADIASFFHVEMREITEVSTFLIPEAILEDVCAELRPEAVEWRTRFQPYRISLYLEGGSSTERRAFVDGLKERFGDELVRDGEVEAFGLLSDAARSKGYTIAAAESCTGGLFGKLITDLPGSSEIFWGSFVTYSNEAKNNAVGVRERTLQDHGAVSEETVAEMAEGVRERSGADVALSISGVAGPSGGSEEKPVGTVCFGIAGEEFGVRAWTMDLGTRRDIIRRRSAVAGALLAELAIRAPERLDIVEKWNYS